MLKRAFSPAKEAAILRVPSRKTTPLRSTTEAGDSTAARHRRDANSREQSGSVFVGFTPRIRGDLENLSGFFDYLLNLLQTPSKEPVVFVMSRL